jgi:hypothetical protein
MLNPTTDTSAWAVTRMPLAAIVSEPLTMASTGIATAVATCGATMKGVEKARPGISTVPLVPASAAM